MSEYEAVSLEDLEVKRSAAQSVLDLSRRGIIQGNGTETRTLENVNKEIAKRMQNMADGSVKGQGDAGGKGRKVDLVPKKIHKQWVRPESPAYLRTCLEFTDRTQKLPENHRLKCQRTENEDGAISSLAATLQTQSHGVHASKLPMRSSLIATHSLANDEDRPISMLCALRKSAGRRLVDSLDQGAPPRLHEYNIAKTKRFESYNHRIPTKQKQPRKETIYLEHSEDEQQSNELLRTSDAQRPWSGATHPPKIADVQINSVYSDNELENALEHENIAYGDRNEVVTPHDLKALYPTEFLNDSCINLYIRVIEEQCPHRERCHFFSTFVFPQLEREIGYRGDKCRAPTRGVDIFEKDYLFFPVCKDTHWSLLVVCFPGETSDCSRLGRKKRILHLDSMGGDGGHSTSQLCEVVKGYLAGEWDRKKKKPSPEFTFIQQRVMSIPMQRNFYDCGVYLLIYMEFFAYAAPKKLKRSLSSSSDFPNFLQCGWFPDENTGLLRSKLRVFIYDLYLNKLHGDHAAISILQVQKEKLLASGKMYKGPAEISRSHQLEKADCLLWTPNDTEDMPRLDDMLQSDATGQMPENEVTDCPTDAEARVCISCSEDGASSSICTCPHEVSLQASDVGHIDEVIDCTAEINFVEQEYGRSNDCNNTSLDIPPCSAEAPIMQEIALSSPELDSELTDEDIHISLAR